VTPSTHGFFLLTGMQRFLSPDDGTIEMPAPIRELVERIYGVPDVFTPGNPHTARVTAFHQHRSVIKDSMGVCDWVFPALRRSFSSREEFADAAQNGGSLVGDPEAEATLFQACTGIALPMSEMERPIAERIVNLERCIDVRNTGRDRAIDEAVIPHYQWE
jgi:aldehyde:ferredoxin oxidoreductase